MIEVRQLTKTYAGGVTAVKSLSFALPEGQTLARLGPSGCGKTTTLKMLNRLIEPTSGHVLLNGQELLDQDAVSVRRSIGYVIQGGALFPHWTVESNVGLVPRLIGWEPERIRLRVDELLALVQLAPGEYRDRYPSQLSGGQRQRIGIARALAADPPVVLLDEPFSALDPVSRRRMQQEFLAMRTQLGKTMVFVTHDMQEAFLLADEIALLKQGELQQIGSPDQLQNQPSNAFVSDFIQAELS